MTDAIVAALVQLGSIPELDVLGKATGAFVAGLAFVYLAGACPAYVRHLVLALTFVVALVIPLIVFIAPRVELRVPVKALVQAQPARADKTPPSRNMQHQQNRRISRRARKRSPSSCCPHGRLCSAWYGSAGAIFMFLSLALKVWRLRRLRRDGIPCPRLESR